MEKVVICRYSGDGSLKTVKAKIKLIFAGTGMSIDHTMNIKLDNQPPTGIQFLTAPGISENDRQELEKVIQGLIGVFGDE